MFPKLTRTDLLLGLAGGADDALAAALVVVHEVVQHGFSTERVAFDDDIKGPNSEALKSRSKIRLSSSGFPNGFSIGFSNPSQFNRNQETA